VVVDLIAQLIAFSGCVKSSRGRRWDFSVAGRS
jgi:hypothetical protein